MTHPKLSSAAASRAQRSSSLLKARMMILSILALSSASATAGQVQNFINAKGGCHDSGSAFHALENLQSTYWPDDKFLGKDAAAWTDEDIAEFKTVYAECLRLSPISVLGSLRADGRNAIPPSAVEAKVEKTTEQLMKGFIDPARLKLHQQQAAIAAREELARAKAQAERDALREQANRDKETAERAKQAAQEEAPLIDAANQDAEAARRARIAAEQRLEEVRQQIAASQKQRSTEDAAANAAKAMRLQVEREDEERREDEALSRTCAVTDAQFGRVRLGMSLREVRRIFGCTGALTSSDQIQGLGAMTEFRWNGAATGGATTTFMNERLVSKSQFGLN